MTIRELHAVYLLTGSNLGDRLLQLSLCRQALESRAGHIAATSRIYETAAWGLEGLPAHLNQALLLHTHLGALELLDTIQSIEADLGRVRQERWGVRSIDIDIIYFDDLIINHPRLTVPHPLMQERNFVLQPLSELAPGFLHPVLHSTNIMLATACTDKLPVAEYLPPSS